MSERRAGEASMWDLVALGEVMLRLDPGEGRIHTTRHFQAWEGGGEYNVARSLRRCFGLRTAVVTALVDNPVGRLIEDLILQGGVDQRHVRWVVDDGIGRGIRNGLNFTERGFGLRAAVGYSDRSNSAASQLEPGTIPWDKIFGRERARWLHAGGVFAALSESTPAVVREAMVAAHAHGAMISYDLNFRPSLWRSAGGRTKAQSTNADLVELADILVGNEEDFDAALGFPVEGSDGTFHDLNLPAYGAMLTAVARAYPNLKLIAVTLRVARTATRNDWTALGWSAGELYACRQWTDLEILDRVGGGDSFATGLIYGLLRGKGVGEAMEYGVAHGALAMTTPGDASMATLADVERVLAGDGARISR